MELQDLSPVEDRVEEVEEEEEEKRQMLDVEGEVWWPVSYKAFTIIFSHCHTTLQVV